ncbi:MAG TPA: hypothetical protein VII31_09795 [Caldimonas sp.]|jgi:hypothetical protein
MRMPRLSTLLPLCTLLALPGIAAANCYAMYDGQNRLVFQSTVSPIDLSTRISETMRSRFPGVYLIMIPDDSDCRELRTGVIVTRFLTTVPGAASPPEETLQAPLLRDGRNALTSDSNATATREAVRSGNALNIKRERP